MNDHGTHSSALTTPLRRRVDKLIIQIPCLNEEDTLPITLAALPRELDGVGAVEWMIIDDGSTDRTVEVAREHGVHHVVRHTKNQGLARAFASGLDAALRLGADIVVNTDADNQYDARDIPALVAPILERRADMVVGDRRTHGIAHFSWIKKRLQHLGSRVVRLVSDTGVSDATSGFRAFSREAAMRLNIVSDFTYTLESLIQAGHKNIAIANVPVRTNGKLRESRLFRSIPSYIARSVQTIVRMYAMYRPLKVFMVIGAILFLAGLALGSRFLYYYFTGDGSGHVQSLLATVILIVVGFQTTLTGLLADLIGNNRRLVEDVLLRVRTIEHGETAASATRRGPATVEHIAA